MLVEAEVDVFALLRRQRVQHRLFRADVGGAGEGPHALPAHGGGHVDVVLRHVHELAAGGRDAVRVEELAVPPAERSDLPGGVDHAGAGLVEDHGRCRHLGVLLQGPFDDLEVGVGPPGEGHVHLGDAVLIDDLQQPLPEQAVADQQHALSVPEQGGEHGLIGGGAGAGDDHGVVAVIRPEQPADFLLGVGEHVLKLLAAVADVVMEQGAADIVLHHDRTGRK